VKLSIAPRLLPTVLLGSAIMSFELLSVYEAGYDTPLALHLAKPMPAESVIPWVASWRPRTNIRLPPGASDFRISHIRVTR
jgi:hypothetical protein